VREVAERVHQRVVRLLRRRGLLQGDSDDERDAEAPEPIEACAQLSLRLGKLGHVDERGVVHEPDADELRFGQRGRSPWSAEHEGFSVHAGVTVKQGDADGRERLCRYVLRHPLSLQRLSWTKDGTIAYEVKYPRSPKHTHLLLDPVQFIARLASLIPPPRHPLVRYFGVLCSASRWRPHVVPAAPPDRARRPPWPPAAGQPAGRLPIELLGARPACTPEPQPEQSSRRSRGRLQAATRYVPWADLLRRVYDIDSLACPKCGAGLRMIALIMEPAGVRAFLGSIGLPCEAPVVARARSPTLFELPPPDYDAT
jgi:hypothetical protein